MPITLTTSPSLIPAPIASQWASNAPTGIGIDCLIPNLAAQSGLNFPAILKEAAYSPDILSRTPANNGSTFVRKDSEGKPSSSSTHIHLCPAAQILLFISPTLFAPHNNPTIKSQCSNELLN